MDTLTVMIDSLRAAVLHGQSGVNTIAQVSTFLGGGILSVAGFLFVKGRFSNVRLTFGKVKRSNGFVCPDKGAIITRQIAIEKEQTNLRNDTQKEDEYIKGEQDKIKDALSETKLSVQRVSDDVKYIRLQHEEGKTAQLLDSILTAVKERK